ncbi:hypothetical protein C3K47_02150 [Solitalea longa]|uniref:TPM domain-containing protein n=1 Tax=Solitalea longa TaxID=2079460 RepID=A0A2S5AAB2_9SPHI|nr:TPM domain-containing protein [Solitalea longa]POY39322.1 hypothetical protein C3K47_02150 [Solitalea longa]
MKYIYILTFFSCFAISAYGQKNTQNYQSYPLPKGWISDFENILTEKEESTLDSLVSSFERQTKIEIAIVTLDSSMTSKENFFNYTLGMANYWGIGKKDLNNGILIGISSSLRIIRIQNGYGIEKILTDLETKKIISDYFIPDFKKGNIFNGIKIGTIELMKKLR